MVSCFRLQDSNVQKSWKLIRRRWSREFCFRFSPSSFPRFSLTRPSLARQGRVGENPGNELVTSPTSPHSESLVQTWSMGPLLQLILRVAILFRSLQKMLRYYSTINARKVFFLLFFYVYFVNNKWFYKASDPSAMFNLDRKVSIRKKLKRNGRKSLNFCLVSQG